jgi:transcription antitermination factor NusG
MINTMIRGESSAGIVDSLSPVVRTQGMAPGAISPAARWYAAYTRANHEKRAHEQFLERSIDSFLPTYVSLRNWKDRRVRLQMPLFPGYVFIRIPLQERLRVLEVPSVARLVGFSGVPAALNDQDIACLRVLAENALARPHPYLSVGQRVRVTRGPLQGAEGILVKRKRNLRVVLSVDLIERSVIVDVSEADLEPVFGRRGINEAALTASERGTAENFPLGLAPGEAIDAAPRTSNQ